MPHLEQLKSMFAQANLNQTDQTVSTYSSSNYAVYDDPMNKNFVYGQTTIEFVQTIELSDSDKVIADIGCGTGFVFDILRKAFAHRQGRFVGIEPAAGMLNMARDKYAGDPRFSFETGCFADIPMDNHSADKVISTLALHWVPDIQEAICELHRILKPDGSADILMIAKNDGEIFKRPVIAAMKRHLTFKQIMTAAGLAQRVSAKQLEDRFRTYFGEHTHDITVRNLSRTVYGTFADHMKWWTARSEQVIQEVADKSMFMDDLETELNQLDTGQGIPFDLSLLCLHLEGKRHEQARHSPSSQRPGGTSNGSGNQEPG